MFVTTSIDAKIIYSVDEFAKLEIDFERILCTTWSEEFVEFVHVVCEVVKVS